MTFYCTHDSLPGINVFSMFMLSENDTLYKMEYFSTEFKL